MIIGIDLSNKPDRTTIHTRINDKKRISSCFRKFANAHFEKWGWETFLWDGDQIAVEYAVLDSADEVVKLHAKILNAHSINLPGEETEE
ncbi:hypothetical protein [Paenibacillus sp. BR1-192]|uniref:hypothetical protein n=2 Tax=unclassified Paenibacillus TaxID=185978 RepID=UPI00240D0BCC|nr:hypothetical protein [Paenibacillus sp. BR1-192]WFB57487.1 hypothetical protein P0X86_26515 [Paenibacillus sp. BR1-192]